MSEGDDLNRHEKLNALIRVAQFKPLLTFGVIIGGVFAALLEGIGVSFILPIVEIVQASSDSPAGADGMMGLFVTVYQTLSIPLTLGSAIAGVSAVLIVRWTATFVVRWIRGVLVINYTREIQKQSFDRALDARIEYFDQEGSDDIMNAIVTQAEYAGRTIQYLVNFFEQGFIALLYFLVAFIIAPSLTILSLVFLGGFSALLRYIVRPGYELGDKVAEANENVQQVAQAGTKGIRDAKLFGLKGELFEEFVNSVNQFAQASVNLQRNEQAINNFYNLLTAIFVFVLIYLAITFADMSLGTLGVFLFAMFRLGPKASSLNKQLYQVENNLPHLVRTQQFIDELEQNSELSDNDESVPDEIDLVEFDQIRFSYRGQNTEALSGISFQFEKGEFIGFVGPSGAGKSTIVSLLTRMYEPDEGDIRVNGRSIHEMNLEEWRSKIAVVRQDPFIFNNTLRYNLTIGNRDISQSKLDEVCEITKVTEFFDDLPNGYNSQLGDEGVRLSGGQRQRVALARALLKDAEILVLDEATSDLDSNLEKEVQEAIENMNRDYAIVGIAHRLSTVKNADRIYTVDAGEIIETGDHDQLIKNDGQYADLYTIQSKKA